MTQRTGRRGVLLKRKRRRSMQRWYYKQLEQTAMRVTKALNDAFQLRPVTAGTLYGKWVAPDDGVLVQRVL